MTVAEERSELAEALAAWDERCAQAPEGQPNRRVDNLPATRRLEAAVAVVAHRAGCTTYTLRNAITAARIEGLKPHEAVAQAVRQAKRSSK